MMQTVVETQPVPVPAMPESVAAAITAPSSQLMAMLQFMAARQRPRDEEGFRRKLREEAAAAGEDFFYSIPFKDHVPGCNRRGCSCPEKPVEGPGVGLARGAARLWGNCFVHTTLEQDLDDAWLVGATFIDFESNYFKHETKRVSKMKPIKGGRMVRAADRELDVVYQQGASKVERDVILRALPKQDIDACWELARQAALISSKPFNEQVARIVRRFSEHGITIAQIERRVGTRLDEMALQDAGLDPRDVLARLRGNLTALQEGDAETLEAFGGGALSAQTNAVAGGAPADAQAGAVQVADVMAGIGEASGPAPTAASAALSGEAGQRGSITAPSDYEALFALLVDAAKREPGRVYLKEAPKGSGRWFLADQEAAAAFGISSGGKICEAGQVTDIVLAGRLTAWIKSRRVA